MRTRFSSSTSAEAKNPSRRTTRAAAAFLLLLLLLLHPRCVDAFLQMAQRNRRRARVAGNGKSLLPTARAPASSSPPSSPAEKADTAGPRRRICPSSSPPPPSAPVPSPSRAEFLRSVPSSLVAAAALLVGGARARTPAAAAADDGGSIGNSSNNNGEELGEVKVFQLPSGLKYVELKEGSGPSPRYGQLVSIRYSSYIKLPASKSDPNPKPERYDKQDAWVYKHGNGRTIPGLDEGLHTMKVGGRRRLVIPPKLGYVDIGLGPIPEYPWDRLKLNNLLDKMVEVKGGNVVMEVELLSAFDDEADQGYYDDKSLTPEEFETLKGNLQRKAAEAAAKSRGAAQAQAPPPPGVGVA